MRGAKETPEMVLQRTCLWSSITSHFVSYRNVTDKIRFRRAPIIDKIPFGRSGKVDASTAGSFAQIYRIRISIDQSVDTLSQV
jgi:hypothetical protein